jgi:hypothetical protein
VIAAATHSRRTLLSDLIKPEGGQMSPEIASIICGAVANADCWGAGRISTAKKAIEDEGYAWEESMEQFIFEMGEE